MVAEYEHPSPALSSGSQGNMQSLEDGNMFIGWGAEPYFSEFSAGGQLLYDAHMHGSYQSYRTYRFPWTGAPSEPPAIAASAASAGSPVTVYASWNGDTRTASWRVLAGPSAQQLAPVASAPRKGFETAIADSRARAVRGRAGARRRGRGARHLAHDRRLSALPADLTVGAPGIDLLRQRPDGALYWKVNL